MSKNPAPYKVGRRRSCVEEGSHSSKAGPQMEGKKKRSGSGTFTGNLGSLISVLAVFVLDREGKERGSTGNRFPRTGNVILTTIAAFLSKKKKKGEASSPPSNLRKGRKGERLSSVQSPMIYCLCLTFRQKGGGEKAHCWPVGCNKEKKGKKKISAR